MVHIYDFANRDGSQKLPSPGGWYVQLLEVPGHGLVFGKVITGVHAKCATCLVDVLRYYKESPVISESIRLVRDPKDKDTCYTYRSSFPGISDFSTPSRKYSATNRR